MKYVVLVVLLVSIGFAQRPGPRNGGIKTRVTSNGGCRMTEDQLKPIVDAHNPFFVNHHWDEPSKSEIVQLTPERFLTIRQEACVRHHIKMELSVKPEVADPYDANFYPREVFNMMNRVFFNDVEYYTWKLAFEKELLKHFAKAGVQEYFNFHVNNLNFKCFFNGGDWGAVIELEVIRLVMKENIRLPGIEAYKDDGHRK